MSLSDSHIHLMHPYVDDPSMLIADMDRLGIARGLLFAAPVPPSRGIPFSRLLAGALGANWAGQRLIRGAVDHSRIGREFQPDNVSVLRVVGEYRDRLRGLAFLNLRHSWSREALALLDDPLLAGVKVHLLFHPCSLLRDDLGEVWDVLARRQGVLLVDLGLREWAASDLTALASRYPEVTVVAAHLPAEIFPAVRRLPNLYVDCAGFHISSHRLRDAIDKVGADKILFGSDSPPAAGGSAAYSLDTLRKAATVAEFKEIAEINFERVIGPSFVRG